MNKKLKIGVLIDDYLLPDWKYKVLEELSKSEFAYLSVIIRNANSDSRIAKDNFQGSVVFRLHKKADEIVFGRKSGYSRKRDIHQLISDVPILQAVATTDGYFDDLSDELLKEIVKNAPDIILKFGFKQLKGPILKIPRFGVWTYSMDNTDDGQGVTAGYYEVVAKNPVTGSELIILGDNKKSDRIIASAFESTCAYSVHLNRDKVFSRASLFVPRVISGIYRYGPSYLDMLQEKYTGADADERVQLPAPAIFPSVKNLAVCTGIFFRKALKKAFYSDPFSWTLLYKVGDTSDFLRNSYNGFSRMKPSKDKFWADPFVLKKEGKYYVFVEEFIYSRNKGHISVLEMDETATLQNVRKIIEKPYHMSYPFIFEFSGNYYMIPETGGNRSIDLYMCKSFPDQWEFAKTIMNDLNAVDTTIFYYRDKWWLFTVIDKIDNAMDGSPELYLFFADNIFSDAWESHPLNPVVSDIRNARPAGKIFIQDGKIYRPSQDCSGRYGRAFNINQVLTLTESEYKEKLIKKIEPEWDGKLDGTHTFNFDSDFTIIDTYSFRKRPFLAG